MKTLSLASLFMSELFVLPLLVLAGLAITVGLRKLGGSLLIMSFVVAFMPVLEPLFGAVFELLPWWFSLGLVAWLVLMIAGRFLRDVLAHAMGELLARAVGAVLTSRLGLYSLAALISGTWLWLR